MSCQVAREYRLNRVLFYHDIEVFWYNLFSFEYFLNPSKKNFIEFRPYSGFSSMFILYVVCLCTGKAHCSSIVARDPHFTAVPVPESNMPKCAVHSFVAM